MHLTKQEIRIIKLTVEGYLNKQIANIYRKLSPLGITNKAGLVRFAKLLAAA